MIKIYGTTLSNYYSTAKAALVEKGLAFEEVSIMPSQDPEVLAKSPMGKVPYIEVEGTTLTETNVIFDYLEDIQPQPALYPSDPWARAKAKEIIRFVELYLDAPARRHVPTVYFGAPVDQAAYDAARPLLEKRAAGTQATRPLRALYRRRYVYLRRPDRLFRVALHQSAHYANLRLGHYE